MCFVSLRADGEVTSDHNFSLRVHFNCLLLFPGVKYSHQILCDTVSSVRGGGGERVGRLVVSPIQLEPSHTLLETQNPKQVSGRVMIPP